MIIKCADIILQTIESNDIEMLRNWRNDSQVRQYLLSNELISPEDQQKWFRSLDPKTSIYFLLKIEDKPAGLVYANHIDTAKRSFEGSIFIGEKQYFETHYPIKAILLLSFYFFEKLNFQKSYSTVNKKNKAALDMDKRFGYRLLSDTGDFIKSSCTREDYLKSTLLFKKHFFGNKIPEIILQDDDDRFSFQRMSQQGNSKI